MNNQKIFLITPLGDKKSTERCHADKMWHSVFKRLSDNLELQCEFVRSDLLPEGGESRIKRVMNLIREARGCIVNFI